MRFAVESAAARRLLLHLATSQAPDEIFFPTLLHLPEAATHLERYARALLGAFFLCFHRFDVGKDHE